MQKNPTASIRGRAPFAVSIRREMAVSDPRTRDFDPVVSNDDLTVPSVTKCPTASCPSSSLAVYWDRVVTGYVACLKPELSAHCHWSDWLPAPESH